MGNRIARSVLVVCALIATLSGCGQDPTPGERVPGLVRELDRIDDSIAAGRYVQARAALDALIEATSQARRAGDLDTARADDIAAAAARLRAALPAARPSTPSAAPAPSEEPSSSPTPEGDDDEKEHGKGRGKGHKGD